MSSAKPLLIPARKLNCADFGGSAGAFVEFEPEFCTRIARGDVRFFKWDGTSWMMDQGDGFLVEITPDDILMTCDRDAPLPPKSITWYNWDGRKWVKCLGADQ